MMTPDRHDTTTQAAVLDAFRAALRAPNYADLVAQAGIDPGQVRSLADFERLVPIIRKDQLFARAIPFHRLCRDGKLDAIRSAMVSSGTSGDCAFAVATAQEADATVSAIDDALDFYFGTRQIPTLLINALAMGVHLPTRHALAETGPRSDSVLSILERFGPYFEQVVILADPHVLKAVVDDGNEASLAWQSRNVSFVVGGDWMSQTLRAYLQTQTGIDDDGQRLLVQTMGLTELGLNVLFESRATIALRRLADTDAALGAALFPGAGPAVPSLFHYDPRRFHVEDIAHREGRELVFTALNTNQLVPMVRYATGDLGGVLTPQAVSTALGACRQNHSGPALPLPCAWVTGRASRIETTEGPLRTAELRHGIYSDPTVAHAITGHFTIHSANGSHRAAVQLRRGVTASAALRAATQRALFSVTPTSLPTDLHAYDDYPFGKDLNYEIKFRHQI